MVFHFIIKYVRETLNILKEDLVDQFYYLRQKNK